ncbi:MAG: hypothetical protein QM765_34765 [Myxococcales bacterium]
MKGLRSLTLRPAYQLQSGGFTAESLKQLAPTVGATLESLTLLVNEHWLTPAHVEPLTPASFPKLQVLRVLGASAEVQKALRGQWKSSKVKPEFGAAAGD